MHLFSSTISDIMTIHQLIPNLMYLTKNKIIKYCLCQNNLAFYHVSTRKQIKYCIMMYVE